MPDAPPPPETTSAEDKPAEVLTIGDKCQTRMPDEEAKPDEQQFAKEDMDALSKVIFKDDKWNKGRAHLENIGRLTPEDVKALLRQGAKKFGFWHLSDFVLHGPMEHLLEPDDHEHPASVAVAKWLEKVKQADLASHHNERVHVDHESHSLSDIVGNTLNEIKKRERAGFNYILHHSLPGWKNSFVRGDVLLKVYIVPTVVFLAVSCGYAYNVVNDKYPKAIEILSWPIFVARAGGMGAALWTALIYLTMSRDFLSWFTAKLLRCGVGSHYIAIFDAHKEIHMFAGKALLVTSIGHAIAHSIGTVPGILKSSVTELNEFLGCAIDDPPYLAKLPLEWARWPACPLEKLPNDFTEALLGTMPGLTGLILLVVIIIISYTGADHYRRAHYDWFWYLHNIAIIIWPVLLFFHGSQGWVGVGIPLVLLVCGLPLLFCAHYKIKRFLRYNFYVGKRTIIDTVTIRPGSHGGAKGALTNIKITKPNFLWRYRPGMYAFISMPEYAPLQWHPFTICSGVEEDTVNFIIAGVGDWTIKLAQQCLDAQEHGHLPKVALDGPYMAPTQTALKKKIMVCVGAGVGITPFLSIMSSFMSLLTDTDESNDPPLLEAHFYWMTRAADEFLLARSILAKIVRHPELRQKMFFHLYTTAREDPKDPASFMFREAVRRQSACDRKAFNEGIKTIEDKRTILSAGSQFPHCWAMGSKHDVLWVREIIREDTRVDEIHGAGDDSQEHHDEHGHTEASHPGFHHMSSRRNLPVKQIDQAISTPASSRDPASASDATPKRHSVEKLEQSLDKRGSMKETRGEWMVPIIFGRPDFASEVRGIGLARPNESVHVYICGNDLIVKSLQEVVRSCNHLAQEDAREKNLPKAQKYHVHFERFG